MEEVEIQHATKFQLKSGANRAGILVYNSGKVVVEGADSELKSWCAEIKNCIEADTELPYSTLSVEIETLPDKLIQKVPNCDDVIIWFFRETLKCHKANSPASAAFMLGAASEKAILMLIECYGENIMDETNRTKFIGRVNNRMISKKYDEFKRSYKSAKPRPSEMPLAQDLEQLLDGAFNFYRHCRNDVGHPCVVPDLDKGVILANIGQFPVYIERIYGLMDFFTQNDISV